MTASSVDPSWSERDQHPTLPLGRERPKTAGLAKQGRPRKTGTFLALRRSTALNDPVRRQLAFGCGRDGRLANGHWLRLNAAISARREPTWVVLGLEYSSPPLIFGGLSRKSRSASTVQVGMWRKLMSQPEQFEVLILGSGFGGKLLAWHLAQSGRRTAVVERRWIGGSCPNIACLPSKNEIWSARVAHFAHHAA